MQRGKRSGDGWKDTGSADIQDIAELTCPGSCHHLRLWELTL